MSVEERMRGFEVAADAARDTGAATIMSCSDQNMDTVIALALHAQAVGADYLVVHAPVLHFVTDRDALLYDAWTPRFPARLGLCRLVQMPGGHETCFTNPSLLADKIVEAGRD